jgi:hypothetical protein
MPALVEATVAMKFGAEATIWRGPGMPGALTPSARQRARQEMKGAEPELLAEEAERPTTTEWQTME